MASERNEHQLLALIEKLQREGHDEAAIIHAVEDATDPQRSRARKRLTRV